jgi:hypothetical protein
MFLHLMFLSNATLMYFTSFTKEIFDFVDALAKL